MGCSHLQSSCDAAVGQSTLFPRLAARPGSTRKRWNGRGSLIAGGNGSPSPVTQACVRSSPKGFLIISKKITG